MFKQQRSQGRFNLLIAFAAVVVAAFGIFYSAKYNKEAAQLEADATMRAAEMQLQAQREMFAPLRPDTPSLTPSAEPEVRP
jgi:hypothetical protein